MNFIIYTNIVLTVVISTCIAASLTDEQIAQIFNDRPDRENVLASNNRIGFASDQDDLDQTLSSLFDDINDSPEYRNLLDDGNSNDAGGNHMAIGNNGGVLIDGDGFDYPFKRNVAAKFNGDDHGKGNNFPSDLNECLQAFNRDYAFCISLLRNIKSQHRGDIALCTTRECIDEIQTLLKRGFERFSSMECQTVGCKITQYVKKSFGNRYGRSSNGRMKNIAKRDMAQQLHTYPSMAGYDIIEAAPLQDAVLLPDVFTNTEEPRDVDSRNLFPDCGTSTSGCKVQVKTVRKKGRKKSKP